jgi:para-nitrobenzyl esterase
MRPSTPDEAAVSAGRLGEALDGNDIRTVPVERLPAAQLSVPGEPGSIDEANKFFTSDRLTKKLGAFTYLFDWQAPGNRFGACHCIDIPFLFGTHDVWDAPMLEGAPKGLENETGLRDVWAASLPGERPGAISPPKLP